MNSNYFVIDTLINGIYYVPTSIDNRCECLAAVKNSIARRANLPRVVITPRKLSGAVDKNKMHDVITEMTKLELDIDGYKKSLYAYIIPLLSHGLILGKPLIEQEDVIYHAREHFMEIREEIVCDQPLRVREKHITSKSLYPNSRITNLSAWVFMATIRKMRKKPNKAPTKLFSVTLADFQKALAPTKRSSTTLEKIPLKYRKFAELFKKELTDRLPTHRPEVDHEITIEADKDIPWGSLYGMLRDELLALGKTLTELLDKN